MKKRIELFNGIGISGLPGSGKSTLAKKIEAITGWKRLSVGDTWRAKWADLYPDGKVLFEEFWRQTNTDENRQVTESFCRQLIEVQGGIIGEARYLLPLKSNPKILRVFVTADLTIRCERAGNPENMGSVLKRRMFDEVKTGQAIFGEGYYYCDPVYYHLVLNSGCLSIEQMADTICSLLDF